MTESRQSTTQRNTELAVTFARCRSLDARRGAGRTEGPAAAAGPETGLAAEFSGELLTSLIFGTKELFLPLSSSRWLS